MKFRPSIFQNNILKLLPVIIGLTFILLYSSLFNSFIFLHPVGINTLFKKIRYFTWCYTLFLCFIITYEEASIISFNSAILSVWELLNLGKISVWRFAAFYAFSNSFRSWVKNLSWWWLELPDGAWRIKFCPKKFLIKHDHFRKRFHRPFWSSHWVNDWCQ